VNRANSRAFIGSVVVRRIALYCPIVDYSFSRRLGKSHGERNCETSMAKSKKKAETVFLVCEETGDHNYVLTRKPGGEKLKLKKYSPRLRKHTIHVEKKK
jgi:large subunit ribosomal protein L33